MANVSPDLPPCICMPTKFSSPYSGIYVIHPVRESVLLKTSQPELLHQSDVFIAPLYGGPAMVPSNEETGVAWYYGFTEDSLFLGKKELAEELFFGKAAVVRKECGQGCIWLFGPHCEHPHYPTANQAVVTALYTGLGKRQIEQEDDLLPEGWGNDRMVGRELLKEIKKHVSNARISALGMESEQIHWVIGKKSYEPEKIRVFLEAIWGRLLYLMKQTSFWSEQLDLVKLRDYCAGISRDVRTLAQDIKSGDETTPIAEQLFFDLKEGSAAFLTIYFKNRFMQFLR